MSISVTTETDSPNETRGRIRSRRSWWVVGSVVVVVVCVVCGLFVAPVWHYSGRIGASLRPVAATAESTSYDLTIVKVRPTQVVLTARRQWYGQQPWGLCRSAIYMLRWPGGSGHVGRPLASSRCHPTSDTRRLFDVTGRPPEAGDPATLDRNWYEGDPMTALGLRFTTVTVNGPLAGLPAWYVPGPGDTWAVMVHTAGGQPQEFLRVLPTVHAAGLPVLVISYRNDPGTAPDPSGHYGYGATEWSDLQAAVDWAATHGAQDVVLFGDGMGASIIASFLQHSDLAGLVRGLVFDWPTLNLGATVDDAASWTYLPGSNDLPFTILPGLLEATKQAAAWRYGIDWAATDYSTDPTWLTVPTLVLKGEVAGPIPLGATDLPGHRWLEPTASALVQFGLLRGAGPLEAWNKDPQRYGALVAHYLNQLGVRAAGPTDSVSLPGCPQDGCRVVDRRSHWGPGLTAVIARRGFQFRFAVLDKDGTVIYSSAPSWSATAPHLRLDTANRRIYGIWFVGAHSSTVRVLAYRDGRVENFNSTRSRFFGTEGVRVTDATGDGVWDIVIIDFDPRSTQALANANRVVTIYDPTAHGKSGDYSIVDCRLLDGQSGRLIQHYKPGPNGCLPAP